MANDAELRGRWPSTPLVLLVAALILSPTLAYRIGVDQGSFAYMAATWLKGGWPYVSSWENDFPGLVFIQGLEILAFGKSIAMFRVFDLIVQLANAYFVFRITSRLSTRPAGLLAAGMYCASYQRYGPWNTAQREGFALLFIMIGFWLYFTAERRRAWITAALIGLGMGIAVTIKPTVLSLSLFYLPLATRLGERGAIRAAVAGGIGLIVPAAIVVVGYWLAGTLQHMYEACIAYQAVYTVRLRGEGSMIAFWLGKIGQMGRSSILSALFSVPVLFVPPFRRERLMVWCGYIGGLYGVFFQGTFAGYHYIPALGLGAVLIGLLGASITRAIAGENTIRIGSRQLRAAALFPTLLLIGLGGYYLRYAQFDRLLSLQFLSPPVEGEFRNDGVFDFTESYRVGEYLREHTSPDEPIQVWGYESLVYYLAERQAASRFQMTHPLVMRVPGQPMSPMQQRWRAEFLGDIGRRQPKYVAVVRDDRWWWAPEEHTSEELLDDFPEWKSIIERDYRLEQTIGRFLIYRRAPGPTA